MINLIKLYIEAEKNNLQYLYKKIEIEKEKREDLFAKRNEVLHETYLLRHRFGRLQRRFEFCLNNKFFLLCVKNKTSLFEKFQKKIKEIIKLIFIHLTYYLILIQYKVNLIKK